MSLPLQSNYKKMRLPVVDQFEFRVQASFGSFGFIKVKSKLKLVL